jgi:hypothetical protein
MLLNLKKQFIYRAKLTVDSDLATLLEKQGKNSIIAKSITTKL